MDKLFIAWGVFFIIFLLFLFFHIKEIIWLKELKKQPLKQEYKDLLERIELYNCLPNKYKKVINFKIMWFLQTKEFRCFFIEINDEIKVNIAFFACLLTLKLPNFCYPSLNYIYVYPHKIYKKLKNEEVILEGESVGDIVVIVWNEAKKEIYHHKKRNVIIHEFAHELDFEEGDFNGIPIMDRNFVKEWSKFIYKEYQEMLKGKLRFIDEYASTNVMEFFAVISEYYFTVPELLKKHYPIIYKELKKIYGIEFIDCKKRRKIKS